MKKQLFTIALCLLAFSSSAQCLTDQINYEKLKSDPELLKRHQQFYTQVPAVGGQKRAAKYIIPVVFHVIHTNGPENISKAQLQDQIRILNEDYSFKNSNKSNIRSIFTGVAADLEIEFRLATIDPQGNCTDGINRVYSSAGVNARDNVKGVAGARWPNNKYLNIWVVTSINSGGAPGTVLGYAQFPSTSSGTTYNSTDGIVCIADYVGSIGTSNADRAGRVLTHEVGHYLGLLHPFQDSCDGGDHCEDTPPVAGTFTNATCNPNSNSCHNDSPDLPDMFENYMDYSEGKCQAMFTIDQKAIVHNTFEVYDFRKNMVSEENLIATGVSDVTVALQAAFYASTQRVCAGKPVVFYDISCKNQVSSRSWTFVGANVTSSTAATPSVTYSQPGFYTVELTVNGPGGSNTATRTAYIEVVRSVAIDKGSLVQSFENKNFTSDEGWFIPDDEAGGEFIVTGAAAYGGQQSLLAPIGPSTRKGKLYRLVSPPVDMRPLASGTPRLSFMCAYAKPNTTSEESIKIYSSNDCGNTWTQRYLRPASSLYSIAAGAQEFVPADATQWKLQSFIVNFAKNDSNVMFMIEVQSDGGGNVYIDNINLGLFNTAVSSPVTMNRTLAVAPVPSSGDVNLDFVSEANEQGVITITNTLGQIVWQKSLQIESGEQSMSLPSDLFTTGGVYFVSIRSAGQQLSGKIIISKQ